MAFDSDRPRKKARHNHSVASSSSRNDASRTRSAADDGQDKTIQSFVEREQALRAIITCKICFRPLYEPFTNQCGHTYCYSCLCRWFGNKGSGRKTCPDCRTIITEPPAPAFALREITRELLQRPELLPYEDVGDHEQAQKEEAAAVETDRNNLDPNTGGVFRGYFQRQSGSINRKPLIDLEDGVVRCPECAWELEEEHAYCNNCGYEIAPDESPSPNVHIDDDLSEEINTEDELDANIFPEDRDFSPMDNFPPNALGSEASNSDASSVSVEDFGRFRNPLRISSISDNVGLAGWASDQDSVTSNSDGHEYHDNPRNWETEDDETSSMNDFLVDDDVEGDEEDSLSQESDSTTKETQVHARPRRVRYTIVDSDDEDDNERQQSDDASGEINLPSVRNSRGSASDDSRSISQSSQFSRSSSADGSGSE